MLGSYGVREACNPLSIASVCRSARAPRRQRQLGASSPFLSPSSSHARCSLAPHRSSLHRLCCWRRARAAVAYRAVWRRLARRAACCARCSRASSAPSSTGAQRSAHPWARAAAALTRRGAQLVGPRLLRLSAPCQACGRRVPGSADAALPGEAAGRRHDPGARRLAHQPPAGRRCLRAWPARGLCVVRAATLARAVRAPRVCLRCGVRAR